MKTLELKLDELAEQAGVSARTVRYYVQRGLLPAPPFRGRDTVYGAEHLLRLQAIRALQARYLPLDEIERLLGRCVSLDDIERLMSGDAQEADKPDAEPEEISCMPAQAWRRWELAPGLELHLSQGASAEVEALAKRLLGLTSRDDFGKK